MSKFTIAPLTKTDGPAVVEHLSKSFCLDEPILNYLNIGADQCFIKMCVNLIDDGISLKAINENGEIVGVFLSELRTSSEPLGDFLKLKDEDGINEKLRTVDAIFHFLDDFANISGYFPDIKNYADGAFLSVDRQYRSYGIGSRLFTALLHICKERNIPLFKVFASHEFTAKLCEKYKMERIYSIPYSDMKFGDLPSIDIPPPHSTASIYCLDMRSK